MKHFLRNLGIGGGVSSAILIPALWSLNGVAPLILIVWGTCCLAAFIASFFME